MGRVERSKWKEYWGASGQGGTGPFPVKGKQEGNRRETGEGLRRTGVLGVVWTHENGLGPRGLWSW